MGIQISITRLFIFALLVLTGCKKETSQISAGDEAAFTVSSSESDVQARAIYNDVFDNVLGVNAELAFGETGVFGASPGNPCHSVTLTRLHAPDLFPVKVVVDFGTGCPGQGGLTRKGKIITIYTGPLTMQGKVAETYFENFFINDMRVQGAQRIENTRSAPALAFKVEIKDGKLTKPNGDYSHWTSKTTLSQIEGSNTPSRLKDDVLTIETESKGALKAGSLFSRWDSRTIQPLIKKFTCRWITKGQVSVRRSNVDAAIIDYGNGGCDNKATMIINGLSQEITLY